MSALPIAYREPIDVLAGLAGEPGAVLLDSAVAGDGRSRWSFLAGAPRRVIEQVDGRVWVDGAEAGDDLLTSLRRVLADGGPGPSTSSPFSGGLIGYIGYEAARGIALGQIAGGAGAQAWFGLYDTVTAFDTAERRAWCIGPEAEALAARVAASAPLSPPSSAAGAWIERLDPAEAERRVATVLDYIAAGDIYQANITQRWTAQWPESLSPFDLYLRLRGRAPGPFSAFLNTGALQLASVSPERFVSLSASGEIETRPIKGTRPRASDPARDRALAGELAASAKDRAENLMIADLMRNDLSRVAVAGSVRTPVLCGLESFPGAHHLVSVVQAQLAPGRDAFDLLAATLPGGSITGAPKVRAMQIIDELEAAPRGPYCGSLMRIGFDGALDSSILIRTLVIEGERVTAQAGGGVVADSDPAEECEEALVKVRPLLAALAEP